MSRYHVADAGTCEAVRQAINSAKPATGHRVIAGVAVPLTATEFAAECARLGIQPGELVHSSRLVVGDDGTTALDVPETPHVEAALGKTLQGTAVPRANQLVQVTRARDNALLPAGVRDKLDDRYVDSALSGGDTPQARSAITVELQNGSRAANALSRWDARVSAQAIAAALGIGG